MSPESQLPTTLRSPSSDDLDDLVELCREHAAYERAPYSRVGQRERLAAYLLGERARVRCLVADSGSGLIGYATWAREASTWRACDFGYLDCLYLRPEARGQGTGEALLRAVAAECAGEGLDWIEWQSPAWNEGAIRFYERLGAAHATKERFGVATSVLVAGSPPERARGGDASGIERRSLRFLGLARPGGWRIKRYGLRAGASDVDLDVFAASERFALPHLPSPALAPPRLGAGFLLVHQGRDAVWTLLYWWRDENVLESRTFFAPLDDPSRIEPLADGVQLACVWELKAIQFECEAWSEAVLARPARPDLDAYLQQVLEGEI